jgi:phage-related protein
MAAPTHYPKLIVWYGWSKREFLAFPRATQREMGYALFLAQMGDRHSKMAKILKGFGGATLIEIKDGHEGNAYRAVYTVQFEDAVYVLHAFQKKSKSGIATPKQEMALIKKRLSSLIRERKKL